MIPRPFPLALGLILSVTLAACAGQSPSHEIRGVVIAEFLHEMEVDDLVIRLYPGELKENFHFSGETIFLVGPVREVEFWEIRDPRRTYLFIKEVESSEDQKLATVRVELYLGSNQHFGYTLDLEENNGIWKLIRISEPVTCPCPR